MDKKEKIKEILKKTFSSNNYVYNYWSIDDVANKIAEGLNEDIPEWEVRFRRTIKDLFEKQKYKPKSSDNINSFNDIICELNGYDTIVDFFDKELKKIKTDILANGALWDYKYFVDFFKERGI